MFNMLTDKVTWVFFVLNFVNTYQGYIVPEPQILVYKPRGFSVSIPHEPGMRIFAFHGNINKELRDLHPGQFSRDIIRSANDKWTFHERRTKLNIGDVIYYWLFVVKDGLGYRLDDGCFTVTDLVVNPLIQNSPARTRPHSSASPGCNCNQEVDTDLLCSSKDNTLCLQSVYNITQSFIELQTRMEVVLRKNVQMKNFIEQTPNARKLTISGKIPPDGHAASTVSFVLREKLNLNPVITSAERNSDGSIAFEVSSVDDKLDILEAAKEKLVYTKILIL